MTLQEYKRNYMKLFWGVQIIDRVIKEIDGK